ncbi:MAG: DUF853 family protein [Bdellovibrionales bacterium]|nr:DUF853 family protein [Bdellovibrionales bacterium]
MNSLLVGSDDSRQSVQILLKMANRHGLITGSTGTGKTITLQTLTEQLSLAGVPVILSDVKGDLSGLAANGKDHPKIKERVDFNQIDDFSFQKFPVCFWDIYGEKGLPLRTTVSEMGSLLLARILDLNDIQTDVLNIVFKYSDDNGLLLIDLKDLKALLTEMTEKADDIQLEYGNVSKSTVGAIVRRLVALESAGGDHFFGEPALDINHLLQNDFSGQGLIHIIDAQKLMLDKRLYSSFLMWILSELFENLPEVGDPEKPKLVFFFDEAHLLFDDAPKYLVEKMETVIRLIRSKGVGIYFISQSPADIPVNILSQLGNKIQHGLRASSEADRKMIKGVAQNYPSAKGYNVEEAILSLGIGESLVSPLSEKGAPEDVKKVLNIPPRSQMGPLPEEVRNSLMAQNPLKAIYSQSIDRESAFEVLKKRRLSQAQTPSAKAEKKDPVRRPSNRQTPTEAFIKSMLRSLGTSLGRQIIRGILGSIKK